MKVLTILSAISVAVMASLSVAQAETMSVSGENVAVSGEVTTVELSNGTTYMNLNNTAVLNGTNNGPNPFDQATMSCMGSCTMAADGSNATCFGSCSGYDADNDIFNFTWDGFTGGGWSVVGGTGKWDGASGGGTWEAGKDFGNGMSLNTWVGELTVN